MDIITQYYLYKDDFWSAYNNNHNNIELALSQVSMLKSVDKEHLREVLKILIEKLKNEQRNKNT